MSAGPPCGGLYLKPPSRGGLCEGVTTMPSAWAGRAGGVVDHDRPGHGRRRRVVLVALAAHGDALSDEHLDGGAPGRTGQRVGVLADVQRTGDALSGAVLHDGLGRGRDVGVVERGVQTRTTVTRGAEDDLLIRILRIGDEVVVGADDGVDIDEVFGLGRLSGAGVGHGASFCPHVAAPRDGAGCASHVKSVRGAERLPALRRAVSGWLHEHLQLQPPGCGRPLRPRAARQGPAGRGRPGGSRPAAATSSR